MTQEFWNALDKLVDQSEIEIDRPKGSAHPRYPDTVYEVAYGYLKNTTAADGEGIDVWLGTGKPEVVGIMCAVDLLKRDCEMKILIGCTEREIEYIRDFHNRSQNMKAVLVRRPVGI